MVANPNDCTEYYNCTDGVISATPETCDDNKVFNPAIEQCEDGWDVPCSGEINMDKLYITGIT